MRLWTCVVLLTLAQVTTPRVPATPTTGTAIIRGKVVDKQTGAPMPRAAVSLRALRGGVSQQNLTDDRGGFEFTKLAPGPYQLEASAGEHRATHLLTSYRPPDAPSTALTLKDGEERADITIALPRSVAVTGYVVDLEGHPLAGVQVLIQRPGTEGSGSMGRPRMTDDRGAFRVYNVPPGRYLVCADARSGPSFSPEQTRQKRFVKTCHPSAMAAAEGREVVVTDLDVDGIEIRMQRHDTFVISGVVLAADGTPAENATVNVTRIERFGSSGTGTTLRGESSFTVSNVRPGNYEVTASIGGTRYSSDTEEREPQLAFVAFEISTADVEGIVLHMKKGATLRGRVIYEDPPTEEAPKPLEVEAAPPRMGGFGSMQVPAKVSEDGTFSLAQLFGPRMLRIRGQLPRGYVVKSVQYAGRDITDVPTEFDGTPGREAEIVLTNRTAELSGTVTDETGAPAVSATVFHFPADPARWKGFMPGIVGRSGKDGRFRLPQLVAGDYYVIAMTQEGYRTLDLNYDKETTLQRVSAVAERITILDRDRRTADLRLTTVPEKK